MPSNKLARTNDDIQRVLAAKLREIKDPRVSGVLISILSADVSADFKFAKVYYSVYGQHDPKELAKGLKSAVPYVRSRIAQELNLRINPEIQFIRDDGIRRGAEISALLKKIEPELAAADAREEAERRAALEAESAEEPEENPEDEDA